MDTLPTTGEMIRHWRMERGMSQMALALDVDVSPRHMSFVETGRANPSAELIGRIAARLAIPAREENALLESAGYARRHRATPLDAPALAQVREVLRFVLERHEPNSAIVFDPSWDIVMANEAHRHAVRFFLDSNAPDGVRENLLRLTFHPEGLRPHIVNWSVVGPALIGRIERELVELPSLARLRALLEEIRAYGHAPAPSVDDAPRGLLLPIHLRKGEVDVRLFSLLSTIGTAIDLTLQELRIETFFPADAESAEAWRKLVVGPE